MSRIIAQPVERALREGERAAVEVLGDNGSAADFEGCFEANENRLGIPDIGSRREACGVLDALHVDPGASGQNACLDSSNLGAPRPCWRNAHLRGPPPLEVAQAG